MTKRDLNELLENVNETTSQDLETRIRLDLELRVRDTIALEQLADNLSYVAFGIAKIVERCFCGHLLSQHGEEGPCAAQGCKAGPGGEACPGFVPVHLAIARMQSILATELGALRKMMSMPMGEDLSKLKLFH